MCVFFNEDHRKDGRKGFNTRGDQTVKAALLEKHSNDTKEYGKQGIHAEKSN